MRHSLIPILCLAVLGTTTACSEAVPQTPAAALTQTIVMPAYEGLAGATEDQSRAWQQGCADTAALKEAFHTVSDRWAAAFHWNIGPITGLLRRERFYHWPERRNEISRGMSELLSEQDISRLEAGRFAKSSVAVQGLPALERLLFGQTDVSTNAFACRLGQAISANLDEIAQGTAREWRDDVWPVVEAGGEHPLYFDTPQDLANRLFTDYLTAFTILKDQKLLAIAGPDAAKAKPMKAEARRSGRSNRTLERNLKALAREGDHWAGLSSMADQAALTALFDEALATLDGLPPLPQAVKDHKSREQIALLTRQLSAIQSYLRDTIAPALGLTIGFNSLDGD